MSKRAVETVPLGRALRLPFPDSSYQVLGQLMADYRDGDEKRAQQFEEVMTRARGDEQEGGRQYLRQLLVELADLIFGPTEQIAVGPAVTQFINFAHGLEATELLRKLVARLEQKEVNFCFPRWSADTGAISEIYLCCQNGTWKQQSERPSGEVVRPGRKSIWLPTKRQKR